MSLPILEAARHYAAGTLSFGEFVREAERTLESLNAEFDAIAELSGGSLTFSISLKIDSGLSQTPAGDGVTWLTDRSGYVTDASGKRRAFTVAP